MKIFINPGHGGSDPGACGNGLHEICDEKFFVLTGHFSSVKNSSKGKPQFHGRSSRSA